MSISNVEFWKWVFWEWHRKWMHGEGDMFVRKMAENIGCNCLWISTISLECSQHTEFIFIWINAFSKSTAALIYHPTYLISVWHSDRIWLFWHWMWHGWWRLYSTRWWILQYWLTPAKKWEILLTKFAQCHVAYKIWKN